MKTREFLSSKQLIMIINEPYLYRFTDRFLLNDLSFLLSKATKERSKEKCLGLRKNLEKLHFTRCDFLTRLSRQNDKCGGTVSNRRNRGRSFSFVFLRFFLRSPGTLRNNRFSLTFQITLIRVAASFTGNSDCEGSGVLKSEICNPRFLSMVY